MNECASQQGCPNKFCINYGRDDAAGIAVHDKKQNRLRCRACGKTWSTYYKEFHYGLRSEQVKIRRAIDMLNAKIPIRTIAKFIKISPSTVVRWKKKLFNQ